MSYPSLIIGVDDVIVLESFVGKRNKFLQRENSSQVQCQHHNFFMSRK